MSTPQTSKSTVGVRAAHPAAHPDDLQPFTDLAEYAKDYAREKPEVVALVCFGVGFMLGWKLKPW